MRHFIYIVRPPRDSFPKDATEHERRIIADHFAYLQDLHAKDVLVVAGPCEDASFGIVVFRADSEEAARTLMENDPAVRSRLFTAELKPFRLALGPPSHS
jgi:uncharacterized protein YciI